MNYNKQYINNDDVVSIIEALNNDLITTGPKVSEFEIELSKFTNYNYVSTCSSGTAALHLALMAIGINQGDEVIIPTVTFAATANAIRYCGGIPVLCDIEKDTLLIDSKKIPSLITNKTKAIIAVDFAGQLADYKNIKHICDEYELKLISDAAHSFGIINTIPDICCYSFHPVKTITTGEGGAVATHNYDIDFMVKLLRSHGRKNNDMLYLGFNYRMSDLNAALGISQLKKINKFLNKREDLYLNYLDDLKVKSLNIKRDTAYHLFVCFVDNYKEFQEYMQKFNIGCVRHYVPIYDLTYYKNFFDSLNLTINYPITEEIKNNIISIPLFYELTIEKQNEIIKIINSKGE